MNRTVCTYLILRIQIYQLYRLSIRFLQFCFFLFQWSTGFILGGLSGFGVTGGAHRFWTHRSYKATTPLRVILMLCFTLAGQNSIYEWVRDHRVHHKFSETDADPHNSNRYDGIQPISAIQIVKLIFTL